MSRIFSAALRALLVVALILTPSLMVGSRAGDQSQITLLVALVAAIFTFMEYRSAYPSLLEFRDAPPFNRLRFVALFFTVTFLAILAADHPSQSTLAAFLAAIGDQLARTIDFPYSPVRLMVLMLPEDASAALIAEMRTAAGVAYMVSLLTLGAFVLMIRLGGWPSRNRPFNLWTNLPTFDPNGSRDLVARLNRDAGVNLVLGFLLPFLIPAVIKLVADFGNPISVDNPQTLIWMVTAWAFVPASMLMRGIALSRVAQMIEAQRNERRDSSQGMPAAV